MVIDPAARFLRPDMSVGRHADGYPEACATDVALAPGTVNCWKTDRFRREIATMSIRFRSQGWPLNGIESRLSQSVA
jgi:hypothetical protein